MLKRLSGTFSQSSDQLLLVPPAAPISPNLSSNSAPSSPHSLRQQQSGYPFPPTQPQQEPQQTLDRTNLHKTLKSFSNLLTALVELRSTTLLHSKAEKKLGKALKEVGSINGWGSTIIPEALLASSIMFETLGETDSKFSKLIQNQYELIHDLTNKYFKKTAKEEKIFEDSLSSLDSKVSKVTQSYNKFTSKNSNTTTSSLNSPLLINSTNHLDSITQSHTNFIQTLTNLQFQANSLKSDYGIDLQTRREKIGIEIAKVLTGLSEKIWRNRIEGVRKGGNQVIGNVLTRGVWVSEGMERVGEYENMGKELNGEGTREEQIGGDRNRNGDPPPPPAQFSESTLKNQTVVKQSNQFRGPRTPSTTSTQNTVSSTSSSTKTTRSDFPLPPSPVRRSPTSLQVVEQYQNPQPTHIDSPPPPNVSNHSNRRVSIEEPTIRQSKPIIPPSSPSQNPPVEQQQRDLGGGRTLPRGWYLDPSFANHLDQQEISSPPPLPLSPRLDQTSPQLESQVGDERPRFGLLEKRQETQRRGEEDDVGGNGEVLLWKPTPRYGSAPPVSSSRKEEEEVDGESQEVVDEWGRSLSSRTGHHQEREREESFVRRMSQKYGSSNQVSHTSSSGTNSQSLPSSSSFFHNQHNRSNSRVSQLAKRYSSPPDPIHPSSSSSYTFSKSNEESSQQQQRRPPLPTPTIRSSSSSSVSFQPSRTTNSYTPQPQTSPSSPSSQSLGLNFPHTRPHPQLLPTIPSASSGSTESHASSSEPHPSFCACQSCTFLHYSHNGKEELTKLEEERLQKELRINRNGGGKGGTLVRGLVGKGKEVFGRMG
ncbi:hypothetical protein JCM3765_004770 [Sporobolomyces pararoseus]